MIKEMTCTVCPRGCLMTVDIDENNLVTITGHSCNRGIIFADTEIATPMRTITTTIRTSAGNVVPVKTTIPVPKDFIFDCMRIINKTTIPQNIPPNTPVITNILETGADVVTTR